jgi:uncharacterized membrane protein YgdD (TMEM256/DUF423 family)
MNGPFWIRLGALFGGLSVAAGAFGAHLLRKHLSPEMLDVFQTAAHYQMVHALALIAVGLLALQRPSRCLKVAGIGFALGILLFSGSLYALTLSGVTKLGRITPLGGVAFLVGWVALMVASLKKPATGAS